MPEGVQDDPIHDGTKRPKSDPIPEGKGPFKEFICVDFDPLIILPPDINPHDPVAIFSLFFTDQILSQIVDFTNRNVKEPEDPSLPHCRAYNWYPTSLNEIKVYIGVLIYMSLHEENEIENYWSTQEDDPQHAIQKYMSRDRFQLLNRRFCLSDPSLHETKPNTWNRVEPLNSHVQEVSTRLWTPGRNVAVDECMKRYTGRAKETTTVPSKPIPTGYKIWVIAEHGYFLRWVFHSKGTGPVGVITPPALGGKKNGSGGNKTQAVVVHLLDLLPSQRYIVYLDNLFTSNALLEYLRELEYGAIGTARIDAGIVKRIHELKLNQGKKGFPKLKYNELHTAVSTTGKVCHILWNDNAPALFLSNCDDGSGFVKTIRHRPGKSSTNATAARAFFGSNHTMEIDEPHFAWLYNQFMNAVDVGDQLKSYNSGERMIRRGGWQAIWNWLLHTVLVNCYLLSIHANAEDHNHLTKEDRWTKQVKFRKEIMRAFLHAEGDVRGTRKHRLSHGNIDEFTVPPHRHLHVKMLWRGDCKNCLGERYGDPPRKRVPLGVIAANQQRDSIRRSTGFGCQECNVFLCYKGRCFDIYHGRV